MHLTSCPVVQHTFNMSSNFLFRYGFRKGEHDRDMRVDEADRRIKEEQLA